MKIGGGATRYAMTTRQKGSVGRETRGREGGERRTCISEEISGEPDSETKDKSHKLVANRRDSVYDKESPV